MHQNLLLIEDDLNTAQSIKKYFSNRGYVVCNKNRGDTGLAYLLKNYCEVDIGIIDINLPGVNGLDICHEIRRANIRTPVIILTKETATQTVINAFDFGANDYLKKPFDVLELQARIESILNRSQVHDDEIIHAGDFTINISQRQVYKQDKPIDLRRREFDLLVYFTRNRGRAIPRDTIIANVWNFDEDPFHNTVDAHVSILRKKIGDRDQKMIETVFGVGYRLRG